MKCKQVDDLLFSYCDRQEIPPRLRRELEEHLSECPECQRQADFTVREREALVYDGDVPEMSSDFVQRVMAAVTQGNAIPAPSRRMSINSQIGSRGLWAIGMVASIVITLLILPGSFKNPVQPRNENQQITDAGKSNVTMMADRSMDQQEISPQLKMADGYDYDYTNRDPQSIAIGRGNQPSPAAPATGDSAANDQVAVFRPSYLPPDYHLVRVESDVNDNISLYYENDQDGYICLKTIPGLEEDLRAVEGRGGPVSMAVNNSKQKNEIQSDPTVITWTGEHEGNLYRLELTGSLTPEELAKVAASVK